LHHLCGKQLLCDCGESHGECLATAIARRIAANTAAQPTPQQQHEPAEEDTNPGEPYRDDVPFNSDTTAFTKAPQWHPSWTALVDQARASPRRAFWEVFAGCARLTQAYRMEGWRCLQPVEVADDPALNVLNPLFAAVVLGIILEGRIAVLHLGPPCSSFSMALNRWPSHRVRSTEFPDGLPDLSEKGRGKVALGNALSDFAINAAKAQHRAEGVWVLEQPASSLMLLRPDYRTLLRECGACRATRDVCMDGAPWRKPTALDSNHSAVQQLTCRCCGGHDHVTLEGKAPDGRNWTAVASPYWPQFADRMARVWPQLRSTERSEGRAHTAGFMAPGADTTLQDIIEAANFSPSGHRTVQAVARAVAAGLQPNKRAMPQLLPDNLPPDSHVQLALATVHPCLRPAALPPHVTRAIGYQPPDPEECNQQRRQVQRAVDNLKHLTAHEDKLLLPRVHGWLQPLVASKSICLMREITFIVQGPDFNFLVDYVLGMPKLGWASHAPGAVVRGSPPEADMQSLSQGREEHNQKLLRQAAPTGDPELDKLSWKKSKAEFDAHALIGPFYSLEECPWPVRLVPRFPIWECHGGAAEWKCRNIDNMLDGGQNATAGTQYAHIPATLDDLASITRSVSEAFPHEPLAGFPSDFAAAYRQATADPLQAHLCAIITWDHDSGRPVFGLAVAQLFGGKSAGLNFCRIPAWSCWVLSVFYAAPFVHCVDDMICIEREATAGTANTCWRHLAAASGWDVPDRKSPDPAQVFTALGAEVDLRPLPGDCAFIKVTSGRAKALRSELKAIRGLALLTPGRAATMVGKLGFAATQLYGRIGRAKLKPFSRRQYEHGRHGMNEQILQAIAWWLHELCFSRPRSVPHSTDQRHTVVTYSDGEGAGANIGIAVWDSRSTKPVAGQIAVPTAVREHWKRQRKQQQHQHQRTSSSPEPPEYSDIFEIEALGPLLVLHNFGEILRGALWIHFIDNAAGLASLVRGSSSVTNGDVIVGMTWSEVHRLQVLPWFDRVESKSNPVDGLSRGKRHGPWGKLRPLTLPDLVLTR